MNNDWNDWLETQTLFDLSDSRLAELGIEQEDKSSVWGDIVIKKSHITAFNKFEGDEMSTVRMSTGELFVINIPFNRLKELLL